MHSGEKRIKNTVTPLLDFALVWVFAYFSPRIVDAIAPYLGWEKVGDFDILLMSPFLAGVGLVSVPIILKMVGFYQRHNVQSIGTAVRQLLIFSAYYMCAIALYNTLRDHSLSFNHTLLVNMVGVPVVLFVRFLVHRELKLHTAMGRRGVREMILAGTTEDIRRGWEALPTYWRARYHVVGCVHPGESTEKEIQEMIERNNVSHLMVYGSLGSYHLQEKLIRLCEIQGIEIFFSMDHLDHMTHVHAEMREVGVSRLLHISSVPVYSWPRFVKSVADRVVALLLLIASSPLWVVAAIGIKLSDPNGKIFYRQMRSGLYGKPFGIWKFRSMYSDADKRLAEVKAKYGNEMSGPIFKLTNDPRIFPFGHFIRKFSIDELPQLLNILMGDMSIVGPRPLPVYETAEFPSVAHRRRLSVKPGLTCFWQVEGRSDSGDFDNMIEKDLRYIDNWSLWLDVVLFFRTIPAVLLGRGAK